MAENKILNKTDGLLSNTSPTGISYKVVPVEWNNALRKIVSSNGPVPASMAGMYTSVKRAQEDITQFLLERWEESDAIAEKNKAKRA